MRALILTALFATSAFAQKVEAPRKETVQRVDFSQGDLIEGGLAHPLGEVYLVPANPRFGSLIKVRMNFDDKLRESVHEM